MGGRGISGGEGKEEEERGGSEGGLNFLEEMGRLGGGGMFQVGLVVCG